jgi:membrane protease YdiL (CAAX protease family)
MTTKRRRVWPIILAAFLAPLVWELAIGLIAVYRRQPVSELAIFAIGKGGFALVLAVVLTSARLSRVCGFAGGLQFRRWGLLWPLWLAAAISAIGGLATLDPLRLAAWALISFAVGFGEEGIFRGVIVAALGTDRPRRAALVSALLFGAIHLSGIVAPIDWRMILAQAVVAFGLGFILGSVRLLTNSIWPGLFAHAVLDFFGIAGADGVLAAMEYSGISVIYLLGSAALALWWGYVLWRRLPGDVPLAMGDEAAANQ